MRKRSYEERWERRRAQQTTRANNNIPVYTQALTALPPEDAHVFMAYLPHLAARHIPMSVWADIVKAAEELAKHRPGGA